MKSHSVTPNILGRSSRRQRADLRRNVFIAGITGAGILALGFTYAVRFDAYSGLLARIQTWDHGTVAESVELPQKTAPVKTAALEQPTESDLTLAPTGLAETLSVDTQDGATESASVLAMAEFGTVSSSGFSGTGLGGYGNSSGQGSGSGGSGSGGPGSGGSGGAYGPGGGSAASAPAGGAPATGGVPGASGSGDAPDSQDTIAQNGDPVEKTPTETEKNNPPASTGSPSVASDKKPDEAVKKKTSNQPTKTASPPAGKSKPDGKTKQSSTPANKPVQIASACSVLAGTDTVQGDLVISGCDVHSPGHSPGIVKVEGDYILDGLLEIEIGGPDPGTGYDQVDVAGDAYLDGIIKVSLIDDYVPTLDDIFDIVLADHIFFGEDFKIIFPELSGGKYWKYFLVQLEDGRWALRLIDPIRVPAPGALLIFAVGIAGLAGMRKFRRSL